VVPFFALWTAMTHRAGDQDVRGYGRTSSDGLITFDRADAAYR
jgi:hypothetical protein